MGCTAVRACVRRLYIFLELVEGGSVVDALTTYGPFPEPLAARYTRQLLEGLGHLHALKIVHRDLKGGAPGPWGFVRGRCGAGRALWADFLAQNGQKLQNGQKRNFR
jgi:serine/threonine protein kinase